MENETTTPTALEAYRSAKAATAAATKALNEELTALKARIAEIHAELGRKPRTKKVKAAKEPVAYAAPPPEPMLMPEPPKYVKPKGTGR